MSRDVRNPSRLAPIIVAAILLPMLLRAGEPLVFGIIGDYGVAALGSSSAAIELSVANTIKRWEPQFIVTVGDNNYPDGSAATIDANIGQFFHEYIHPYSGNYGAGALSNRFFPTVGNHDWPADAYRAYFSLPGNERYYSYRQGPVEIFAVNSNLDPDGTTSSSVQGTWLRNALAASSARWKLVFFHHPPYSSDRSGAGNSGMRWPFATWGAHAVFAGHDHIYARIHTNGITYFINGLGGHAIDSFASTNSAAEVRYRADYGAMRAEATETNLIFHFVTRNNVVIDSFVLGSPVPGPVILASPLSQEVIRGRTASFDVLASGTGTLRYQWQRDGTNVPSATARTLTITNVQPFHAGDYAVIVSSGIISNRSKVARLNVPQHPIIRAHPTDVVTRSGYDVTLSVRAEGFGPLHYQWLFNDAELPGATASNLFLGAIEFEQSGDYRVRVTDDLGSITSQPARVTVLTRPQLVVQPISQSAVMGEDVTFSVRAIGSLPLSFSWRRDRRVLTNIVLDGFDCFFSIHNVQLTNAGGYQVGVTNLAGLPTSGLSSNAVLVVLADGDGDGLPDEWESAHNFRPNDPLDAALDPDLDGQSNLQEYRAGTDPADRESYLKIDTIERAAGTRITFGARSNKTYTVQFHEALGAVPWQRLHDVLAAPTNRLVEIWDPATNATARFYRVLTPRAGQ